VQSDRYIRAVLTIIAVCQLIGAIRTLPPIPIIQPAMAHGTNPATLELSASASR